MQVLLTPQQRTALAHAPVSGDARLETCDLGHYVGPVILSDANGKRVIVEKSGVMAPYEGEQARYLEAGAIRLDTHTAEVWVNGELIAALSSLPYRILRVLMPEPHRFISKAEVYRRVWEFDMTQLNTRCLDVALSRLRGFLALPTYFPARKGDGVRVLPVVD